MTGDRSRDIIGAVISFIILIILIMVIFGFSAQNGENSGDLSGKICMIISDILSELNIHVIPERLSFTVRKTAHMTEYACVFSDSLWLFRSLLPFGDMRTYFLSDASASVGMAFITVDITAASDEIHQLYVPGRAGLWTDVLIDMSGAFAAFMIINLIFAVRRKIRNKPDKDLQ